MALSSGGLDEDPLGAIGKPEISGTPSIPAGATDRASESTSACWGACSPPRCAACARTRISGPGYCPLIVIPGGPPAVGAAKSRPRENGGWGARSRYARGLGGWARLRRSLSPVPCPREDAGNESGGPYPQQAAPDMRIESSPLSAIARSRSCWRGLAEISWVEPDA